jgi:nitrogenase molybdenum-iron protein alpha/beta subunit
VEREGWTEVGDSELISGASDRIGPNPRSWVRRVDPGLVVVIAVTFLALTGEDTPSVVVEEAETVDCDVLYVDALGTHGDLHHGYASVLVELLKRMDLRAPAARPREVGVLGYLLDRYEGDHAGNLAQLKRLVSDMGLRLGPVMLSGRPWADVQAIGDSGVLVQRPYAAPHAKALRRVFKRTDRAVVHTDLPMGLRGSTRWLRLVARAAGAPEAPVLVRAAAREQPVRARLASFVAQLQGRRFAA